jgi:gamma-glutamylcyclotransferase (GGCT)/AIG2-like uncharacterized protein YtfP
MEKLKRPVFVYGTLKSKERLHWFIKDQAYIGKATTVQNDFVLKEFAKSYPIAFRNTNPQLKGTYFKIKGELYDMEDKLAYDNVKMLEENSGYTRVNVLLDVNGQQELAEMYTMNLDNIDFENSTLGDGSITTVDNAQEWGHA